MKTDFNSSILFYFAVNIHQFFSLQIVWRSLSERINFLVLFPNSKYQPSRQAPGIRLTKMKPAVSKFLIRPNAWASIQLDSDGVYKIPRAAIVSKSHSFYSCFVSRSRFDSSQIDGTRIDLDLLVNTLPHLCS
jgi:hypothetical protein